MPPRLPRHVAVVACLLLGCGSDAYDGELQVRDGDDVERVAGLSSVRAVVVDGDHGVERIAWPKLTTVTDRLVIRDQAELEALDLSGLTSVGMLVIERNPQLTTIRLPHLRSVGSLVITGSNSTALELPALTHVAALTISNVRLESLALPVLERLGDGTSQPPSVIGHNVLLTSLRLPRLGAIAAGATLMIERNPSLTTIDMPALTSLDGGLTVMNNVELRAVKLDALAHVAESSPFFIRASPALTRVHVPALDAAASRLSVDFVRSPWGEPKRVVPREGLEQAAVSASGVVLLGYTRPPGAVFEARDRAGKLLWTTTVTDQHAGRPIQWTRSTLVSPSTTTTRFTTHIVSASDDQRLHEVVGLAADTGVVQWREPGIRSWIFDQQVLVQRPRADGGWADDTPLVALSDARLADPTLAEVRIGYGDQPGVYDQHVLGDRRFIITSDARNNVIAMDARGVTGRVTSRVVDTVVTAAGLLIVCDPAANERSPFEPFAEPEHVFACPDPSAEAAQLPAELHAVAAPFLHLAPKREPYLAVFDGRSAPRPLRLGPAVIAPLDPRVVPLALVDDRLVLAVSEGGLVPRRAQVVVLGLDRPTVSRVEGLEGGPYNRSAHWAFLPEPLGRHLPLVFEPDDGARLHLLDLATGRIELTLPIRGPDDFLYQRNAPARSDGLVAFDVPLDYVGDAMTWIAPGDPRATVVAAYQLRDARGIVSHAIEATPRQVYFHRASNAFGAGLHVASVQQVGVTCPVIIDILERHIVWSECADIRLVDLTDIVAERWSQAWAR